MPHRKKQGKEENEEWITGLEQPARKQESQIHARIEQERRAKYQIAHAFLHEYDKPGHPDERPPLPDLQANQKAGGEEVKAAG